MEEFKKLLEYFVSHLQWSENEDKNHIGYQKYIEPIVSFNKTGRGYKGEAIQNQIKEWENYNNNMICISINYNPKIGYKSKSCYLNWKGTGLNIIANWEENNIVSLGIEEFQWEPPAPRIDLGNTKSLTKLGLFDNEPPNENLESFFNTFKNALIEKQNQETANPYVELLKESKNLILTGAPGTGKTFLAKEIAKIIIGVQTEDELNNNEQFCFVQFHPSYDYTDFVEGLRPTPPDENGNIGFALKDGVFKSFCKKARTNFENSKKSVEDLRKEITLSEYLSNFIEYVNQEINDNGEFPLVGIGGRQCAPIVEIDSNIFRTRAESQNILSTPLSNILNIYKKYKENQDVRWTFKYVTEILGVTYHHTYFFAFLKAFDEYINDNSVEITEVELVEEKNYIILIDEINRGEISKIFGELFFSIDPSYRGKKGAVKTQYSNLHENENEIFYIPENVYIIGTMNDIDRSVESFDFAMRRRFVWQEITAEESANNMGLPDEVKFKMFALNNAINQIEGLNSSYHIGGAYFLDRNGSPRTDYDNLWNLRILPLLKEYLRGMPNSEENLMILKSAFYSENRGENNG